MASGKIEAPKFTLSGYAKSVNFWTNDNNCVIEIYGITKKFTITISANGTISGSVTDL